MVTDVSISECLAEGWERYKQHIGLSIGGLLLGALLMAPASFKYLDLPWTILVNSAITCGWYLLYLNVSRDTNPRIQDLFGGFKRYGTVLGLYFTTIAATFAIAVPFGLVAFGFGVSAVESIAEHVGLIVVLALLYTLTFYLLTYRFMMVYFIIMDEPRIGLFDALRRSSQLVKGNGHNFFLLAVLTVVLMIMMLVLLVIPLIIFGSWLGVCHGRFYVKLKEMHAEEVAQIQQV